MNNPTPRWFECRHLVTFGDTNTTGSIYFANYFIWQGECREQLLARFFPEFTDHLIRGFTLTTESASQEFYGEATLFDVILIRLSIASLTRSRIELEFEFVREQDGKLLGRGAQAVVWTNPQRRPSLMPDKLFDAAASYFGLAVPSS